MISWGYVSALYHPLSIGDYSNPRTGHPVVTQAVFHGSIRHLFPLDFDKHGEMNAVHHRKMWS